MCRRAPNQTEPKYGWVCSSKMCRPIRGFRQACMTWSATFAANVEADQLPVSLRPISCTPAIGRKETGNWSDRKSTRLELQSREKLVCRLLLVKKKRHSSIDTCY